MEEAKREEDKKRACREGEVRLMIMLRKHKSFSGKPTSSWRQKEISITKADCMEQIKKFKTKLSNAKEGGGVAMCRKKWENLARQESDAECAKTGSVVGPWTKSQLKAQGMHNAAAGLKV